MPLKSLRRAPWAAWFDGVLICGLLALTFLLGCFLIRDMDIWWHLKAGQAILDGRGIPTHDNDTFGAAGHEWIDLHWLFQIVVAWLYRQGGSELLTIAAASTAALGVGIALLGTSGRISAPWLVASWILPVLAMSNRFIARPEMFTLVCLASYLCVLRWAEQNLRKLWWLIPIQLLWVNTHGLFVFGPFLLACWLIERGLRPPGFRDRHFRVHALGASVCVILACLANPYGLSGAIYPIALARTMFADGSFFAQHIPELAPTLTVLRASGYRDPSIWAAGALFAAVLFSFYAVPNRINTFRVITFAAFSGLAVTAVRNLPQFAVVAGAVLARNLADCFQETTIEQRQRWTRRARVTSAAALLLLAGWVGSGGFYRFAGAGRRLGFGEYPLWHAHAAARFASGRDMPRHILAFHEGQAAVVEFHMRDDQRVFVDPRLEVMRRPLMERYYRTARAVAANSDDWQKQLGDLPQPLTILIDHNTYYPLESTLLSSPDWKCAWFGPVAAVYVPVTDRTAPQDRTGDFRMRHFGVGGSTWANRSNLAGDTTDGTAANLREGAMLLKIASTMGQSSEERDVDRQLLILNAMRLFRECRDRLPDSPVPLRFLAHAAIRLYGYPSKKSTAWRPLELLGVARGRLLLRHCREQFTPEFRTLSEEFTLVVTLGDIEAAYPIGIKLTEMTPPDDRGSRFLAAVRRTLVSKPTVNVSLPERTPEQERLVGELFEARRFQELQDLFRPIFENQNAGDEIHFSWETCDRIATACLLCGDPQGARDLWGAIPPKVVKQTDIDTRLGLAFLVEEDYAHAVSAFERAVLDAPDNPDARCGLAMCHLELGNAEPVIHECEAVLKLAQLPEGLREFCTRLRDFASRNARARE